MQRWIATAAAVLSISAANAANWTSFRGAAGNGTTSSATPPAQLGEANLAWKAPLPGRGLASPVVVNDKVYVTCSSGPEQKKLHVIAFDEQSGVKEWERTFWATGRTMCHNKTCVAAPSPTSDGKRIFTLYSSNDLVCLDLDGNLLWLRGLTRDYPNASNSLGMSSSPIVVGDTLIVQVENDSESFTAGIDVATGVNRWKIDRPKSSNWTSPVAIGGTDDLPLVVALQSTKGVDAVDPSTGKTVWSYTEGSSTIPSSAVSGELLLVPSKGLTALRPNAHSEAPEIVWQTNRLGPATASPVVVGDRVFTVNRGGVLSCGDSKSGEILWKVRVKGPFSGSPVSDGDRIYLFNEDGLGQIVDVSGDSQGKVVSEFDLGETILSTAALAGDAVYVRSDQHLWKFGK